MNAATEILEAGGGEESLERLLPLVYEELRTLAGRRMAAEQEGQTLQPTALVHEAWLRLARGEEQSFENRAHFFAAAAEAMRRILIERARRKRRHRHGGGAQRIDLETLELAVTSDGEHLLAVDEALGRLALHDPLGAQLVKLRFFAGLPNIEAARLLGLSERTAKRTWAYARAWLYEELKKDL
jgi:RNA polymerase sigma factor (TIGR02999 family)